MRQSQKNCYPATMKYIFLTLFIICFTQISYASLEDKIDYNLETIALIENNLLLDYEWAEQAPNLEERLIRFNSLWINHHWSNDEYEDAIHARYVRKIAYELTFLHYKIGNKDFADKLLTWLKENDDQFN